MSRYKITGIIYAQLGMNEWVKCYTWEFPHKHSVFTVWDKHMPYIEGERRILKRSRANNMCPIETQAGRGGGVAMDGYLRTITSLPFSCLVPHFPKNLQVISSCWQFFYWSCSRHAPHCVRTEWQTGVREKACRLGKRHICLSMIDRQAER